MRQSIVALAIIVALVGSWVGLVTINSPSRYVVALPKPVVNEDADIALYLRYRSEGHLVGRYH